MHEEDDDDDDDDDDNHHEQHGHIQPLSAQTVGDETGTGWNEAPPLRQSKCFTVDLRTVRLLFNEKIHHDNC